jgi:hypothetical protein
LPEAPSCTGLIARSLADAHGWAPPPALVELVRWADIIDAAAFASAEEATSMVSPAARLAVFLAAARIGDIAERAGVSAPTGKQGFPP